MKANPKDIESVDAIIAAVYEIISGNAGEERDWDRFRSLYHPQARMIPTGLRANGEVGLRVMGIEEYITNAACYLENEGFFEREIARTTESFGRVTHVFSAYESRHKENDAEPFSRGINSIQLLYNENRWWIMNVLWDSETEEQPIPEKYLTSSELRLQA
jgi:hypothetical protein